MVDTVSYSVTACDTLSRSIKKKSMDRPLVALNQLLVDFSTVATVGYCVTIIEERRISQCA